MASCGGFSRTLTTLTWASPILGGQPRPAAGLLDRGAQSGPAERPVQVASLSGFLALRANPLGSATVGFISWRREERTCEVTAVYSNW